MENSNSIYLKGLNGLRAIAAISILISHVSQPEYSNFSSSILAIKTGFDGVTLFFVLSGFLITFLLLNEDKKSKIDVKKFYVRRILRIWPLYYLFIVFCLVVCFIYNDKTEIFSNSIFYYLFFTANIPFALAQGVHLIMHFWSISVEEQFYAFWPWFIKIFKNKLFISIFYFIVFLFLVKFSARFFLGKDDFIYRIITVTRFHCMLIGALAAIIYFQKFNKILNFMTNKFVQIFFLMLFVLLTFNLLKIPAIVSAEITSIISVFIILGQVENKNFKFSLETKMLNFLGKISYGIYVIHPLMIYLVSKNYNYKAHSSLENNIYIYGIVILLTIVLSKLSYELFEKKFLKMKSKYTIV